MDSNPGGVGLFSSVELCWWDVSAVAVQPIVVEPVHPGEGGEFEFVDLIASGRVGPVDALGLVEAVGRLGQRVVEGIRNGADARTGADLVETLGETY